MLENIEVFKHSSIKFNKEKVIYFDPFKIDKNYNDADFIMITHEHFDHYSEEDILKVKKDDTIIVLPESMKEKPLQLNFKNETILGVEPNKSYSVNDFKFETIPAYNINKNFHPKANNWVGYIIYLDGIKYYIAGDTDAIDENINLSCDVAFIPIGGTYTMNYKEGANLVNEMKPKIVVPIHYGEIVGNKKNAEDFKQLINR